MMLPIPLAFLLLLAITGTIATSDQSSGSDQIDDVTEYSHITWLWDAIQKVFLDGQEDDVSEEEIDQIASKLSVTIDSDIMERLSMLCEQEDQQSSAATCEIIDKAYNEINEDNEESTESTWIWNAIEAMLDKDSTPEKVDETAGHIFYIFSNDILHKFNEICQHQTNRLDNRVRCETIERANMRAERGEYLMELMWTQMELKGNGTDGTTMEQIQHSALELVKFVDKVKVIGMKKVCEEEDTRNENEAACQAVEKACVWMENEGEEKGAL